MYKYKSRCRFTMLLYVEGTVLEVRPQEILTVSTELHSRFLEELESPKPEIEVIKEVKVRKNK